MRINKQDYLRSMAMFAPVLTGLYRMNGNPNEGVVDDGSDMQEVPNDLYVYYDFVAELFDDILDKIVIKGEEYVGKGNVLDAVYDATARRVGGVPTRDDVLRTIFMMKDKNDIALLRSGVYCKDAVNKLIDCIVYDLMALYALKDNEVYNYLGEESAHGSQEGPIKSRNG